MGGQLFGFSMSKFADQEQRRLLYERIVFSDIHTLQRKSRFTAKCHYNREKIMRNNEESCLIISRICGISGVIAPLLESKPRLRLFVPMFLGCAFYCADQLREHFQIEKERSFRAAGKWMSLYTTATAQKSKIISAYVTTSLSEGDVDEIRMKLYKIKADLDNDPDSTTNDDDFAAANRNFDEQEALWLADSIEEITRMRSMLGMTIPMSKTPLIQLAKLCKNNENNQI